MNKCWCGSGLDYEVCHREFDKKINYYKKRGVMTPPRSMIKNQQQIEGIKKAAVVNNGLLDHIEKNIKIGMSTEDIDVLTREYLKENIYIKLTFSLESTPKRIVKFFDLENELNLTQEIFLQDFKTRREAKVTTWWVKIDELDNNLQSKLVENLYFAWEILDITGKTGGYNLQFCWTSWAIVWKSFANK